MAINLAADHLSKHFTSKTDKYVYFIPFDLDGENSIKLMIRIT